MSVRIKVTGFVEIDDDEYDPGPNGPLTEMAFVEYANAFSLDDIDFTVADADEDDNS